jgi:hypothetical protein
MKPLEELGIQAVLQRLDLTLIACRPAFRFVERRSAATVQSGIVPEARSLP